MLYPSTLPAIAGSDAIRKFWFPSSSLTRVVAMALSIDRVHVNVLRRQRDGSWLIWKRMWGDLR